ncbi:MAG TPA: hydroxymethylbilane synthase [Polyangiaceae bacterium]|nr:hydroxymethylbilane synthase [Polyangiaceae bacterium]
MSGRELVLATRRSALALAQARAWAQGLLARRPGLSVRELHVVTTGDRITDRPLQAIGGKGLFLKEIEEALVERRADFAVHSIKDVPAELAQGLRLAAVPAREDPRDVLVSREGRPFRDLPQGALVGTSSLRRVALLRRERPDLRFAPLRGNVDTRLRKVAEGECDAIVLAYAGLRRLGLGDRATEVLAPELSLPAVGQGALGIECREGDEQTAEDLASTHDPETSLAVSAERGVMVAVGGSCQVPVAAYARREGAQMHLRAMLADAEGNDPRFAEERFAWPADDDEARARGEALGRTLVRH